MMTDTSNTSARLQAAISTVLIDIDGTLVQESADAAPGHPILYGNGPLSVIAESAAIANRSHIVDVAARIRHYIDSVIWWDYPDVIADVEAPDTVWDDIVTWHAANLVAIDPMIETVKRLHAIGLRLCIMSNNPVIGCRLKLQVAGLATRHSSGDYFTDIFGSNNCYGQKHSITMWERCLQQLAIPPAHILVIGDNPVEDGDVPGAAGIAQRVILDPAASPFSDDGDGCLRVQDPRMILDLLGLPQQEVS